MTQCQRDQVIVRDQYCVCGDNIECGKVYTSMCVSNTCVILSEAAQCSGVMKAGSICKCGSYPCTNEKDFICESNKCVPADTYEVCSQSKAMSTQCLCDNSLLCKPGQVCLNGRCGQTCGTAQPPCICGLQQCNQSEVCERDKCQCKQNTRLMNNCQCGLFVCSEDSYCSEGVCLSECQKDTLIKAGEPCYCKGSGVCGMVSDSYCNKTCVDVKTISVCENNKLNNAGETCRCGDNPLCAITSSATCTAGKCRAPCSKGTFIQKDSPCICGQEQSCGLSSNSYCSPTDQCISKQCENGLQDGSGNCICGMSADCGISSIKHCAINSLGSEQCTLPCNEIKTTGCACFNGKLSLLCDSNQTCINGNCVANTKCDVQNCKTCLSQNVCQECELFYGLTYAKQCEKCPENCLQCKNIIYYYGTSFECTICDLGYQLAGGKCTKIQTPNVATVQDIKKNCFPGYMYDGANCVQCRAAGCKTCQSNINKCDSCLNGNLADCSMKNTSVCTYSALLTDKKAVNCASCAFNNRMGGGCQSCIKGFKMDAAFSCTIATNAFSMSSMQVSLLIVGCGIAIVVAFSVSFLVMNNTKKSSRKVVRDLKPKTPNVNQEQEQIKAASTEQ